MHSRVNHLFAAAALSWGLLFDILVKFVQSPDFGRIVQTAAGFAVAGYTTLVAKRAKPVEAAPPPTLDVDALAVKIAAALRRSDDGCRRRLDDQADARRRLDEAARNHDPGVLRIVHPYSDRP